MHVLVHVPVLTGYVEWLLRVHVGPSLAHSPDLDLEQIHSNGSVFGPTYDVLSPLFGRHYVLYLEELQDPGDGSLLEPTGVCPDLN